jgi:signal transduction histidine kinase
MYDPGKFARIFNQFTLVILAGLSAGLVYEVVSGYGFAAILIAINLVPILASLYLIRRNRFETAAALQAFVLIGLITVVATKANGIRQIGVIGYPAILIIASLVIRGRVLAYLTLYNVACIAWLILGDVYGVYTPALPSHTTPGEFAIAAVILAATAFMSRLLTRTVFEYSFRLQQELQERRKVEDQRKALIDELEEKNAVAGILRESAAVVALPLDFNETVSRILDQLRRLVPYDSASVQLLIGNELEIIGGRGFPEGKNAIGLRFSLDEADPAYPIVRDGSPFIMYPDIQQINDRFKGFFHEHILSWMAIPLHARGRLIGMFALDGFTANKFTEAHARYALSFANQVAVTLENTRLYTELQAELKKQVALRAAITAITSVLHLNQVLGEICRQMASAIDATSAYIANYDPAHASYQIAAEYLGPHVNDLEQVSDLGITYYRKDGAFMFDEKGTAASTVIHSDDASLTDWARNNLTSYGAKSVLYIPLHFHGRLVGHTELWEGRRKRLFTNEEISFCQVLSQQAAIAIENANLFEELQRELQGKQAAVEQRKALIDELEEKNAVAEILRESLASIVGTLEFNEIIQRILDQIGRVIPFDSASVWRFENKKQRLITQRNLPPGYLNQENDLEINPINSAFRIYTGELSYVLSNNVQEELLDFRDPPHDQINSWLAIPLKTRGKIIGLIALDGHTRDQFNEHHAELAVMFANQVAIALENSSLFSDLQAELVLRRELITELESKNSELERFTYTVSHDLKSPLFTIRGFLGYLEQDTLSGNHERMRADLQRITDATDKMQRLLNELLELSRIGRLKNEPVRVPMQELAREAVELVQGRIMTRGIAVHIDEDLPVLFGDRQRLLEVLQNLVDNAAKFMGDQPAPRIDIGMEGEDSASGMPIFHVRDNGIGIAPELHERIFGLFNKLDPRSDGTGIGLTLVKRIIEVHGGRIWVESEPGKGSAFLFTLPGAV